MYKAKSIIHMYIYIYYLFFFGLVSMSAQCCAKPVSKAVYDDMRERGYAFVAFIQWSVSFFLKNKMHIYIYAFLVVWFEGVAKH